MVSLCCSLICWNIPVSSFCELLLRRGCIPKFGYVTAIKNSRGKKNCVVSFGKLAVFIPVFQSTP